MIYVEFFQRDRHLPLEIFRMLGDQASWVDPDDKLVLNVARTMRIGPHPGYLAFWRCPGMKRLDEWEAHFNSAAALADVYERASLVAINLSDAGCYDEVIVGPPAEGGLQYIEFFDAGSAPEDGEIALHFEARARAYPDARLNFVVRRIGLLGPKALGDIAVWTFRDYVAVEAIARERHAPGPCRPHAAGVYRPFGKEIL
ncbi:MAG: hypothetical protein EXQ94_10545 [Alphaproteobacteria bacterium]|nr:hypothetical protein [Alphaproteobacteria bacterium]